MTLTYLQFSGNLDAELEKRKAAALSEDARRVEASSQAERKTVEAGKVAASDADEQRRLRDRVVAEKETQTKQAESQRRAASVDARIGRAQAVAAHHAALAVAQSYARDVAARAAAEAERLRANRAAEAAEAARLREEQRKAEEQERLARELAQQERLRATELAEEARRMQVAHEARVESRRHRLEVLRGRQGAQFAADIEVDDEMFWSQVLAAEEKVVAAQDHW